MHRYVMMRGRFHEARDVFQQAKPAILEPIVKMQVTVPGENVGDINSDMSSRRVPCPSLALFCLWMSMAPIGAATSGRGGWQAKRRSNWQLSDERP